MPTNKQRREAERRHLERQLQRRRRARGPAPQADADHLDRGDDRADRRSSSSPSSSLSSGNDKKKPGGERRRRSTSPTSPVDLAVARRRRRRRRTRRPRAPAVTFNGVTVKGATDLKGYPVVTSKGTTATRRSSSVKDLVVGKGKAAKPDVDGDRAVRRRALQATARTSTRPGSAAQAGARSRCTGVVPGFTQGIGGDEGHRADEGRRPADHHHAVGAGLRADRRSRQRSRPTRRWCSSST